jgi:hypothetical protein
MLKKVVRMAAILNKYNAMSHTFSVQLTAGS